MDREVGGQEFSEWTGKGVDKSFRVEQRIGGGKHSEWTEKYGMAFMGVGRKLFYISELYFKLNESEHDRTHKRQQCTTV